MKHDELAAYDLCALIFAIGALVAVLMAWVQ